MIKVKNTKKYGRGLFATKSFQIGDKVEVSPVVVFEEEDKERFGKSILNLYQFGWTSHTNCIALGLGSLFNHDTNANVAYTNDFENNTIVFTARRRIKKGEQLFVNYGYDPVYHSERMKKERLAESKLSKLQYEVNQLESRIQRNKDDEGEQKEYGIVERLKSV